LGQKVAVDARGLCVKSLPDVWDVVFQGTGEAMSAAHVITAQTAARFDAWLAGTQGRVLGVRGLQFVAMSAQKLEREFGGSGVLLGRAGRKGFARPREGEGGDGKAHEAVIHAQRGAEGALV
jgi:hypothetical protein